jgi:hypothetical protein
MLCELYLFLILVVVNVIYKSILVFNKYLEVLSQTLKFVALVTTTRQLEDYFMKG